MQRSNSETCMYITLHTHTLEHSALYFRRLRLEKCSIHLRAAATLALARPSTHSLYGLVDNVSTASNTATAQAYTFYIIINWLLPHHLTQNLASRANKTFGLYVLCIIPFLFSLLHSYFSIVVFFLFPEVHFLCLAPAAASM